MGTSRTFLQNASTRHAIFVQRYAGSQIKEVLPALDRIREDTIAKLSKADLTKISRSRLNRLLKQIDLAQAEIYEEMGDQLKENMQSFGEYEADFSARMFTKATVADFETPSSKILAAAVLSTPMQMTTEKIGVDKALKQFSKVKRKKVLNIIKDGAIAGRTSQEIIKDVDFVSNKINKYHAASLVRTITNHISSTARQLTIEENSDIIEGVEWVSTLDSRTSETCRALDGKVFPKGKGPRPPQHWGCRSTVIPRVKDKYSIRDKLPSERPSKGSRGVEIVDGRSTYNSWLKRQSKGFQDEALGKAKGKLFREGGLSMDKFVDKNYSPLTLDQLKKKEPLAFERAGL